MCIICLPALGSPCCANSQDQAIVRSFNKSQRVRWRDWLHICIQCCVVVFVIQRLLIERTFRAKLHAIWGSVTYHTTSTRSAVPRVNDDPRRGKNLYILIYIIFISTLFGPQSSASYGGVQLRTIYSHYYRAVSKLKIIKIYGDAPFAIPRHHPCNIYIYMRKK